MLVQASTLLALAASASSHIIMEKPAPFAWEDSATQQAPLAPSDYPCKQPLGTYKATGKNTWNAGETLDVQLIGGATHGGGSCQFSITTDTKPSKQSQWKVIHSVIGQCPPGSPPDANLSQDRNTKLPTIPVKMPENVPAGEYTFAWTWVNKIGNREFYMNCAPIQVGGSSGASASSADVSSALGSLPDMFTINLPATQCSTKEGQDFEYPNPGKSVTKGAQAVPGSVTQGSGCAAMEKLGAGSGSLGAPSQGESPSQPSEAPASSAKPVESAKPAPTAGTGGIFAPGASSAPAAKPTAPSQPPAPTQPTAPAPTAQPPVVQPPTAPTNGTQSSGPAGCTPCTNDGAVVCIGSNQFGLCNRGCAVPQPLAAGMACTNGAVAAAVKAKRHIHFPRAHLRGLAH